MRFPPAKLKMNGAVRCRAIYQHRTATQASLTRHPIRIFPFQKIEDTLSGLLRAGTFPIAGASDWMG
jgi:hypothetical protein